MHEPHRIELEGGTTLVITWDDGRVDRLSSASLRSACPCATCRNAAPPTALSIVPDSTINDMSMVGAYAINLVFSPDGHATGIFPFPLLRMLGEDSSHKHPSGRNEEQGSG
ncbi:MAG: DUF971 domain-containing protein [Acidobacteria bacterium]|nr:MAG: DUF971 domain-containing protein [Acidobacteriota bacterium]